MTRGSPDVSPDISWINALKAAYSRWSLSRLRLMRCWMSLTASGPSSSSSSFLPNWLTSIKRNMAMMRLMIDELLSSRDSPEMMLIF